VAVGLWHVSEDGAITRFEPRANDEHDSTEALVWAIDDDHVPAYWFPRDCPRGTFWAIESTGDDDIERFLTGDRSRRVHAISETSSNGTPKRASSCGSSPTCRPCGSA
jgi:hypothetical protein